MLRIASKYVTVQNDGREAPIGLSIVREDGIRLVADLSVAEAVTFISELSSAIGLAVVKPEPKPVHTVRGGKPAAEFGGYGVTHDMDCPGCQGTSFTASPRSETYWSS